MTIDRQALPLKRRSLPVAAPPPSPPHRARPPIMRPRRWIGVLIGLILSFGSTAAGVDARSFEVVAHRGEATRAPENSIAAIHAAAAAGVTWVELDLRYTKDGIPLVIHDDYVGRVTGLGHNRRVADLTFAQIRGKCLLWANGGCSRRACTPATRATCVSVKDRAPSLWEALKVAKRVGLRVFLDVKVAAPNETARMKTIRAFVDTGTHKDSIIIAFDGSVLSDLRTAARSIGWTPVLGLLSRPALAPSVIRAAAPGLSWALPEYPSITPDYVTQLHEAGFKVGTWTPNTPEAWRPVVAAGVDAILTDQVADLIADQP
jgi:glycerophosphoryl diester phosphodiesterase